MTAPDLSATAADMGRAIAAGNLDPVDLAEAHLAAIDASPHRDRIYARTTPDRARAEALAARDRARAGVLRGPLDGVPISWKDLVDSAGVATESGTVMLKGRTPEADAVVLANATRAGLVCLGKTHLTELAFSGLGLNPSTATPPNRHDPGLAPGGSSSGAAASTAYGLAAAGIGSDTGGSVRIPAAWNDLVGFKTTVGSLPMDGVVPLCARFDTIGPLCRSVEDAALLFAAMAGGKAPDLEGARVSDFRFLILGNPALAPMDDTPQDAFEDAVVALTMAGAKLKREIIRPLDEALPLSAALFAPEAYGTWGHLIEEKGDLMFGPVRERFQSGKAVSAPEFVAAWQKLDRLRLAFRDATAAYDAILLPTSPILPPKTADLLADHDYFVERNLGALRNTRVGNLMNMTGCTLPTGVPHCGLMVLCQPGREAQALRIASAVEKSL